MTGSKSVVGSVRMAPKNVAYGPYDWNNRRTPAWQAGGYGQNYGEYDPGYGEPQSYGGGKLRKKSKKSKKSKKRTTRKTRSKRTRRH